MFCFSSTPCSRFHELFKWLIFLFHLAAQVSGNSNYCVEYEKLGCFNDNRTIQRPLPVLIGSQRGALDWSNLKQLASRSVLIKNPVSTKPICITKFEELEVDLISEDIKTPPILIKFSRILIAN